MIDAEARGLAEQALAGNATAVATAAAALSATPLAFVSKVRNGGMAVAQRGTSGSVAAAATAYTLDGWMLNPVGAAGAWAQEIAANLAGTSLRLSAATGLTGLNLQQRIESFLAAQLLTPAAAAQPVTFQATIRNGTSSAITPTLATYYPTATDNFASVTGDLSATSLQAIPAGQTATVSYTFTPNVLCQRGYQIVLAFGGALNAASGYVDIGAVDLRAAPGAAVGLNSAPPAPDLRPIGVELALCQRYFCKTFPQGTAPAQSAGTAGMLYYRAQYTGADYAGTAWNFPVAMRATPSITFYNPSAANANWRNTTNAADSGAASVISPFVTSDRGTVPYNLQLSGDNAGNILGIHATASAEL